jgi:hypothetical protein
MQIWARISGNGRSLTVVTGEFLASRVSAWALMAAYIYLFFF